MVESQHHVLIVEDDEGVADLYRSWVFEEWTARIATTVADARSTIDEDVDLVVLDRHLPDGSGREVFEGYGGFEERPPVLAVTATDPDFDVVDLPIDDYLVKPVDRETFRDSLERLAGRISYDAELRALYALASKKAVLEARKSRTELAASEEYADLENRVDRQRERADDLLDRVASNGYRGLFRGLFHRHRSRASK
jgi:DNA-binding response OmpR family regulator